MKRFIFVFMIIGALMCVLYMGVVAESNLNNETTTDASEETGGQSESEISSQEVSSQEVSSQEVSSQETSSEEVSSQEISSKEVSSEESNENTETSSAILGVVSVQITTSNVSYENTTTISSEETKEEPSSSKTSSRYGDGATDPTIGNNENDFDEPASDMSIQLDSETDEQESEDEGGDKNIFNLSKILKGLIFIPIVLALASVGALIYVNRKEFAGAKTKKAEKKNTSGQEARKKNNK